MINPPDLNAVADAVMDAHVVIEEHGTHEMKTMSRLLLFTIGMEIAQRSRLAAERQDHRRDEAK